MADISPPTPFFGVPIVNTPAPEVRACLKTQLSVDIYLDNNGALGEVTASPSLVSPEQLAIAQRFCNSLND
jgi:hypothetical protein